MKQPQDTWSGDQVLVPESTEELPELPEELPEALPRGERIVWQGKPSLQGLLQGTFHFRLLAIYFSVLIGILFAIQFRGGGSVASSASDVLGYVIMAAFAMGIIWVFAFLLARTTTYSITTHRVVMQCGVALPVTMSFPFPLIESADVRIRRDGSGEIALLPESANPLLYVLLFPHVKPLSIFRVKPVLRGIPDAAAVATDLARLMTDDWQDAMAAGKAAPSRRSDEPPKRDVGFWELNGVPLALAAGLTIFTLGGAWLMQEKNAAFGGGLSAEASTTVDLFFEDRENGAVEVVDAATGAQIAWLEQGDGNFVRGTLRGLVRLRRLSGIGAEQPFALHETQDGRLVLEDPATDTEIDLIAFGQNSVEDFARFLSPANVGADVSDARDSGVATIALSSEERSP